MRRSVSLLPPPGTEAPGAEESDWGSSGCPSAAVGALRGHPRGAANGCHRAPGYVGNVSLGSLSERHCLDGICVRMVSPLDGKKETTENLISAWWFLSAFYH